MLAGSGSAGFYRGTSRDQTPFFQDKEKKLVDSKKWPAIFEKKVDLKKVNMEVMRNWVAEKLTEILGLEDDILIQYTLEQLSVQNDEDENVGGICPKRLSVSLTAFLGKKATVFVSELWSLLLSASSSPHGVPKEFIEKTKLEMQKKREEAERINSELLKRHEIALKAEFERQMRISSLQKLPSSSHFSMVNHDTKINTKKMPSKHMSSSSDDDKDDSKKDKNKVNNDKLDGNFSRNTSDDRYKKKDTKNNRSDDDRNHFKYRRRSDDMKHDKGQTKKYRYSDDDDNSFQSRHRRDRERQQSLYSRKRGRSGSRDRSSEESPCQSRRKFFNEKKRKKKPSLSRSPSHSPERCL